MKISFARVVCDGKEESLIKQVLESGWLTTATKTQQLESLFGKRVQAEFACAVNSCTAAMHLAAEALGVKPGDKVLVPTMTFTATAEIVRYMGADPVFLDVAYGSALITPEILAEAVATYPQSKVLMVVHYGGQGAEMFRRNDPGILDICRMHGIRIIEDAAHAFPAYLRGEDQKGSEDEKQSIGSIGDVTCFSFYANKTITTGEGGMLTTNNPEIAKRARLMRLHGIDRDVWDRYTSRKSNWEYDVVAPGFKYNMPDIAAAIGLAQLEQADHFRNQRQRCARFYFRHLKMIDCIDLPEIRVPFEDHAWHLFGIILKDNAPVSRNRFIDLMTEKGIGTSVHYKPLHRMTYYRQRYELKPADFPNAERMWRGCVSLPIYPSLTNEELEYIVKAILGILC